MNEGAILQDFTENDWVGMRLAKIPVRGDRKSRGGGDGAFFALGEEKGTKGPGFARPVVS